MFVRKSRLIVIYSLSIFIILYYSFASYREHTIVDFQPNGNRTLSLEFVPLLERLDLFEPKQRFSSDESVLESTPVFVSAWTRNFHRQGELLCKSLLAYSGIRHVDKRLIVYNLLLSDEQISDYRIKCPIVEFRDFDFTPYPQHIRYWSEFRWKPILIAHALLEFPSIWWFDSSIIFRNNESLQVLSNVIRNWRDTKIVVTDICELL